MRISRLWLQKYFDAPLPSTDAISDALTFHVFEIDGVEEKNGDAIFDVKVTANRGADCLSHRGIAKELSAILQMPISSDPLSSISRSEAKEIDISIETPELCRRYIACYIKGVKVGPSPAWLKERLEAVGQRSINNVVDATNFVMFDIGQPLHAFDAGKLIQKEGKYSIGARSARPSEQLHALDGIKYELNSTMLVIIDENNDESIGIAGIKGGVAAQISETTTDIILESANFNGVSVRKTASALRLRTDASARFEQGISPELAACGMQSVVELIQKIAGGEVIGFVDMYPAPQEIKDVSVSISQVTQLLGGTFGEKEITDAFTRLGFEFTKNGETYTVTPPFERLDLLIAEDLVEEVGRIIGYDHVPAEVLPPFTKTPELNQNFYTAEKMREELAAQGYSEIFTSVFSDTGERVVANKVDGGKPFLRNSLLTGLADALEKNKRNKELLQLQEVKLFEIGPVWKNGEEKIMVGAVSEKEKAKEQPLEHFFDAAIPSAYENLPLSTATRYQPFSKYPYIVRDVAVWTPASTDIQEVQDAIKKEAGDLCVKIYLFDRFEKGEKVSLAFRLIFQSFDRTLTETQANEHMEKVANILKNKGFKVR